MKFIKKPDAGELDIYIPERPTLPIYLPRDVFYPFTLFSSNAHSNKASMAVLGAVAMVAAVVNFAL